MTWAGVDIELTLKYGRCISEFAQPLKLSKLLLADISPKSKSWSMLYIWSWSTDELEMDEKEKGSGWGRSRWGFPSEGVPSEDFMQGMGFYT